MPGAKSPLAFTSADSRGLSQYHNSDYSSSIQSFVVLNMHTKHWCIDAEWQEGIQYIYMIKTSSTSEATAYSAKGPSLHPWKCFMQNFMRS